MEYWTIIDNRHAGPFTARQLADMDIRPDTPVWHEGLPDWVPAREISEIAAIMIARQNAHTQPQAPAPAYNAPAQPCNVPAQITTGTEAEPCPPTYLAWSIIVTILCCQLAGIPAIIFSAQVKSAYRRGEMAKARKMSEWAQWFIIIAIVLGVLTIPLQMAFSPFSLIGK